MKSNVKHMQLATSKQNLLPNHQVTLFARLIPKLIEIRQTTFYDLHIAANHLIKNEF